MQHTGLTSAEVAQSRAQYGENLLTPPPRDPWWVQFIEKFNDPVIRILLIAAFISFGIGALEGHLSIEGIGVVIAVLLATGLAFINEFRANREFDVLNQSSDEASVKVMRDGRHTQIGRREVVVGDLVELSQGDEIPADGHVLSATSLEVNESAFTGESLPVRKVVEAPAVTEGTYAVNHLLRSTMVVDGGGSMVVEKVGDATEIGKTARLAAEETGEQSPLNAQLERLAKWIGVLGFAIASGTFAALIARGAIRGDINLTGPQWWVAAAGLIGAAIALIPIWLPLIYDFFELTGHEKEPPKWLENGAKTWLGLFVLGLLAFGVLIGIGIAVAGVSTTPANWIPISVVEKFLAFFMIAVTIIVVAVPEGLAMSVTLSLAYSMRRMTATNCLVRKMDACETIGAATHICSDKTGTLTMNEMRLQEAYFGHDDKARAATSNWASNPETAPLVYEAFAVNSTANLGVKGQKEGETSVSDELGVIGNPTEGSLLLWMNGQGQNYENSRQNFGTVRQFPFSTERKFMATMGKSAALNGQTVAHFKGAPDILMARCSRKFDGSPFTDANKELQNAALTDCQARGMRTLAFAIKSGDLNPETDLDELARDLTWLGFVAIADPVRGDVAAAVEKCQIAGIDVKIVTGDNPLTAREIARQIGLWKENGAPLEGEVMLGPDFAALSDEQASQIAPGLKVLARARPADKLRLVDLLQKKGAVVAVTGDGTNDAPALNYAQVGLAMGKAGTAVAKEASDIIILDDSFASIATAVKWGRSLYLNIQKFILFQLTINVVACGIAFLGPFIGVDLPLTVMQMLWVNLIMDTFAALALATEPPEERVMDKKPRGANDFIVSPEMARQIFGVGIFFIILMILALRIPVFSDRALTSIPTEELAKGTVETTAFFTFFVLLQFWNMFNARTLGSTKSAFSGVRENPYFLVIAAAILFGQFLIVTFGGTFFRVVPLGAEMWLKLLAVTSLVLIVGEIVRFIARSGAKSAAPVRVGV